MKRSIDARSVLEEKIMETFDSTCESVEKHYAHSDLATAILSALAGAGKDLNNLQLDDLAPIDEFHIRGQEATLELARKLNLDTTKHVLDVGCGIGGASRRLAMDFSCRVTGLDLTEEYCQVAEMLSHRLGLAERVTYHHGNALDMPFDDNSFDVVWTQHTAMNIRDKSKLYMEILRVLKSDGSLAIYDILAGSGGPVHYPVPWARNPTISFLIFPEEMRSLLEGTGFEIVSWRDTTEAAYSWFQNMVQKIQREGKPILGYHILLGPDFPTMAQNQIRNLNEGRIVIIEAIARRP